MKTNRKPDRCLTRSDRVPSAVIALLMALLLTTSTALNSNGTQAQSKRKRPPRPRAQVKPVPSAPQLRDFEFETVTLNSKGAITARRKGQARYYIEYINGVGLDMVEIPGGSFMMGSPDDPYERPVHRVNVAPFFMGKYEVTQAQWRAVAKLPKVNTELDPDAAYFKGNNRPVEQVRWEAAMEFCARLYKATGRVYRLPSEAEWEYACRAGTTTAFAFGETITPEVVNYDGNSPYGKAPKGMLRKHTVPVGSLGVANGFGLYDMHGNVEEWCMDAYHFNQSYDGAPTDGGAWNGAAQDRVARGGDYNYAAEKCRSAHRSHYLAPGIVPGHFGSDLGFRVVATLPAGAAATVIPESQQGSLKSAVSTTKKDEVELQHDWHIEEGQNGVNYISRHPAPPPFSYNQEPEATLVVESTKISGKLPSLTGVVDSEIRTIRKKLQLAEYLEADAQKPQNNVASWVEEIDGQQVAFIKYRAAGVKGGPRVLPRTTRHAILIKNGTLYFAHLTVIFARHQEEVRADQIRLIKGIIRK